MKITHVLSDGTILKDIQGHVVKVSEAESVYNLIDHINNENDRKREKNGETKKKKQKT